jgi:hypothetical protein
MRFLACWFSASLTVAMAASTPARADFPWMFAQITCAPILGYFSIRRITVWNLPDKGPYLTDGLFPGAGVREALERDNGIFGSESLSAKPFTCSIPEFKPPPGWGAGRPSFDVKVIGHYDRNSEEGSYCRIVDNIEVFVNGKSIGLMVLNPCKNSDLTVSVEVAHNGVELASKRCVEPLNDVTGEQIVCTESPVVDAK